MMDLQTTRVRFLLQARDITSLGLATATFPISRIWTDQQHRDNLLYHAQEEMHLPWSTDPEISEGKTKGEMIASLMNEPIRNPIGLDIWPTIGFAFLHYNGNNRLSAALLRELPTIPAYAACVVFPQFLNGAAAPTDHDAITCWNSMIDGSRPLYTKESAFELVRSMGIKVRFGESEIWAVAPAPVTRNLRATNSSQ